MMLIIRKAAVDNYYTNAKHGIFIDKITGNTSYFVNKNVNKQGVVFKNLLYSIVYIDKNQP